MALVITALALAYRLIAAPVHAAEALVLDPAQPYTAERFDPVTYDVDFSVVVTPPYKTKKLRVWLPIPPSDRGQEVSVSDLSSFQVNVEPLVGVEPKFGNRFAYFEFDSPQGAQMVRHRFRIKTWELRWGVDPRKVARVDAWPAAFEVFRRSETQAVVVDERFVSLLDSIVPERADPASDLADVMKWVQANFVYDHRDASLAASSEHGLVKRRGHCSDYHGFCAALGRALGAPTRVTYGINAFPKNSPSHCKLEAFLPPYGWVSFDVSETQKLIGEIRQASELNQVDKETLIERAHARLASGFRDNTWFLQTRGTDYDLEPPAKERVAAVRTAYVEADGVALPEPDPADKSQTAFSWMTIHDYRADRKAPYPFTDWSTLRESVFRTPTEAESIDDE